VAGHRPAHQTHHVPRWQIVLFVIGDAAGYVEPFTGEGMAWALAAADGLAPLAARAVGAWDVRCGTGVAADL
jgi:flavin-dependent dehydrogenase